MDKKEIIETLKELEGHLESVKSDKAFANDNRLDEILSKANGQLNDLALEPIIEQPEKNDSRETMSVIVEAIEVFRGAISLKIELPNADAKLTAVKNSLQSLIEKLNG